MVFVYTFLILYVVQVIGSALSEFLLQLALASAFIIIYSVLFFRRIKREPGHSGDSGGKSSKDSGKGSLSFCVFCVFCISCVSCVFCVSYFSCVFVYSACACSCVWCLPSSYSPASPYPSLTLPLDGKGSKEGSKKASSKESKESAKSKELEEIEHSKVVVQV